MSIGQVIETEPVVETSAPNTELEVARQIQSAFVPDKCFGWPGTHIAARRLSGAALGGDFHNAVLGRNGVVTLVVGHVDGHGYAAALAKAMLSGAIRSFAREGGTLRGVVNRLNLLLGQINDELRDHSVTCSLAHALVDHNNRTLTLAIAGDCQVLLRTRGDEVVTVGASNPRLGHAKEFDCRVEVLQLDPLRRGLLSTTPLLADAAEKTDPLLPSRQLAADTWRAPLDQQLAAALDCLRAASPGFGLTQDTTVLAAEFGDELTGLIRSRFRAAPVARIDAADPSVFLG